MQMRWHKKSGNCSECYTLSSREKALIQRGYDEAFIRRVNHVHDDTQRRIAEEIFNYITRDCVPVEEPKALYIGGQTGSGKSVLVRALKQKTEYEYMVPVCIDNYRTWHPHYEAIETEIRRHWAERMPDAEDSPGNDMADFTHAFASDLSDLLIDALSTPICGKYYSMVIEWGMRTSEGPLECMALLKQKGYDNQVIFMCVPGKLSLEGCRFRDDYMNSGAHIYRRVPLNFHQLSIETIAQSCGEIYHTGLLERQDIRNFYLVNRQHKVIWQHGDPEDPVQLMTQMLECSDAESQCSLEEAQKTYYIESVGLLHKEKWFDYLMHAEYQHYNAERVHRVEQDHKNYVLNYTEQTLRYAESFEDQLPKDYYRALVKSLQWSEVAKAGSENDREGWLRQGIDLSIHNEASAEIYLQECLEDSDWMRTVTEALIRTHGMMGQMLRGETSSESLNPLKELLAQGILNAEYSEVLLYAQNRAVIRAASVDVWHQVNHQIHRMIRQLCGHEESVRDLSCLERIQRLFPHAYGQAERLTEEEQQIYTQVFEAADLWYPQVTLDSFSREEILNIFHWIVDALTPKIRHISFERLMHTLYYDYEGFRRVNVYKKRIMEYYIRTERTNHQNVHVKKQCFVEGATLFVDITYTEVCSKLIDFCVEAERSGLMEYQKNIITIFDLFGFRRDIFDRLNNEDKYLETMNDTASSRKNEITDYVTGDSVVDVGSGGGVLLDVLERKYPKMQIIGTDISFNVIEALKEKIRKEGHAYHVQRHNFVEGPLGEKVDNIIFSSILHEVYSYTEQNGRCFQIDSVKDALVHAIDSLKSGGRIIIRDGVLSKEGVKAAVRMKTAEGVIFARNYLKDFKGLLTLKDDEGRWLDDAWRMEENTLYGDINLIREFLYTYTWGVESYSCEINEQFGYFTLEDYVAFLQAKGLRILCAEAYLEQGYPDHLNPLVELKEGLCWQDMPSNCMIIAEKID